MNLSNQPPTQAAPLAIPEGTSYLRLPQVQKIFPMSRSKIYGDIAKGKFPAPLKLGARTSVWSAQALRDYAEKAERGELA